MRAALVLILLAAALGAASVWWKPSSGPSIHEGAGSGPAARGESGASDLTGSPATKTSIPKPRAGQPTRDIAVISLGHARAVMGVLKPDKSAELPRYAGTMA